MGSSNEETRPLLHTAHDRAPSWTSSSKLRRILFLAVLMFLYSFAEISFSLYFNSLVMFSDGLHNLSDGLALGVAFWAEKVKSSRSVANMTYGWQRSEVIGGLFNGLFLIALTVFLGLQAVPKFIEPTPTLTTQADSLYFMIVAGVGIFLNIVGVTLFSDIGHGHSHGGGGGDDGGHGHGHGGDGSSKDSSSSNSSSDSGSGSGCGGNSHDHQGHHKEEAGEEHHGHGHGHGSHQCEEEAEEEHHGHGHGHGSHQREQEAEEEHHGHGHGSHHKEEADEEHHGHGHGHGSHLNHQEHHHIDVHADHADHAGHDHHGHGKHGGIDHNMWGLLIHFIGDVFTSSLVCGVGALYYFFVEDLVPPHDNNQSNSFGPMYGSNFTASKQWVLYADPTATIISVLVIGYSAWGLIKSCGWVLLQGGPAGLDIDMLRKRLANVKGVHSVHELHVWQLTGSVNIASLHVLLHSPRGGGSVYQHSDVLLAMSAIKEVLHAVGVHSSTIQPEFISEHDGAGGSSLPPVSDGTCALPGGPCVESCDTEDSCCTPTTRRRSFMAQQPGGGGGDNDDRVAYGIN